MHVLHEALGVHLPPCLMPLIAAFARMTLTEGLDTLLPKGAIVKLCSSYPDPLCYLSLQRSSDPDHIELTVYSRQRKVPFDVFVQHVEFGCPLAPFDELWHHMLFPAINHGLCVHIYELLASLQRF